MRSSISDTQLKIKDYMSSSLEVDCVKMLEYTRKRDGLIDKIKTCISNWIPLSQPKIINEKPSKGVEGIFLFGN